MDENAKRNEATEDEATVNEATTEANAELGDDSLDQVSGGRTRPRRTGPIPLPMD